VTSDPNFKVMTFFEVEYRKKKNLLLHKRKLPNIWNGAMFVDLD